MKATLLALLAAVTLHGCGIEPDEIFPNSPERSFIKTGISTGPTAPFGPTSAHTTLNPTGAVRTR